MNKEEPTFYFEDENDWWAWEWSQTSRFWVEGMFEKGLEKFKKVAFENLQKVKGPKGIPILYGEIFSIAKAPVV